MSSIGDERRAQPVGPTATTTATTTTATITTFAATIITIYPLVNASP